MDLPTAIKRIIVDRALLIRTWLRTSRYRAKARVTQTSARSDKSSADTDTDYPPTTPGEQYGRFGFTNAARLWIHVRCLGFNDDSWSYRRLTDDFII